MEWLLGTDWGTNATFLASSLPLSVDTSTPSTVTHPRSGGSIPHMQRSIVVFPTPFGPRTDTSCPGSALNSNPSRTLFEQYENARPLTSIISRASLRGWR